MRKGGFGDCIQLLQQSSEKVPDADLSDLERQSEEPLWSARSSGSDSGGEADGLQQHAVSCLVCTFKDKARTRS